MNFDYFNYKSNDKVKKGSIIFSQPLMNDKNFKRSIILICEHGRDGSFGYKLNDKVDCEYLEINVDKKIKNNLYYGGPVDNTFLNFVHNDNDLGGDKLKIKEFGKELSGGMKQRIGLCRALYRSQNWIFIDEGTSAIDMATESLIIDGLKSEFNNYGIIASAHRESMIKSFDKCIKI